MSRPLFFLSRSFVSFVYVYFLVGVSSAEQHQPAASLSPACMQASRLAAKARNSEKANKLKEAIGFLQQGIKLCPDSPIAQLHLAQLFEGSGQFGAAEALSRQLVAEHPLSQEAKLTLADSLYRQQKYKESVSIVRAVIAKDPLNVSAYLLGGELEHSMKLFDRSIELYLTAIKIRPSDPTAHLLLGNVYEEKTNYPLAIAAYKESIRQAPDSYRAYTMLGLAYRHTNQVDAAIEAFRTARAIALKTHANYDQPFNSLTDYFIEKNRTDEAMQNAADTIRVLPNSPRGQYLYAKVMHNSGKEDEALMHAKQAVQLAPNASDFHFLLGTIYSRTKQRKEADAEFAIVKRLIVEEQAFNSKRKAGMAKENQASPAK